MQSKKESLKESLVNVVVGYMTAFISQLIVFPLVGVDVELHENLIIGVYFTGISIIRSYTIRRYFNKI